MIPSVLAAQLQKGVEDFLKTTFPVSTPFFHGIIDQLLTNWFIGFHVFFGDIQTSSRTFVQNVRKPYFTMKLLKLMKAGQSNDEF